MSPEKKPPHYLELQKILTQEKLSTPIDSGRAHAIIKLLKGVLLGRIEKSEVAQIFSFLTYKSKESTHCSGMKEGDIITHYKKIPSKQRFRQYRLKEAIPKKKKKDDSPHQ